MNTLFTMVLVNAAIATALFVAELAARRWIKSPVVLHWLLVLVLVKLITPPIWTPKWSWLPPESAATPIAIATPAFEKPASESDPKLLAFSPPQTDISAEPPPALAAAPLLVDAKASPTVEPSRLAELTNKRPKPAATIPWPTIQVAPLQLIAIAWLLGAVGLFALSIWRIWRLERCLRFADLAPKNVQEMAQRLWGDLGLRSAPRVLFAPGAISPMLWVLGFSARIIVPAELFKNLIDSAQRSLLLHELVHYRRGDHWVRYLELAVTCLYWWFPVAWLIRREIRKTEELACDAEVVARLPGDRRAYAEMLVHTVASLSSPAVPALASGIGAKTQIEERVRKIMRPTKQVRVSHFIKATIAIAAVCILPLAPIIVRAQREESKTSVVQEKPVAQTPGKLDWLRGEGESLEIRLRGKIVDAGGKPAKGAKLKASIYDGQGKSTDLTNTLNGDQFETWVPVGKLGWFSIFLDCQSSDGKQVALQRFQHDRLRQAAIDGVELSLQPYDRVVDIKVVEQGKPVEGAKVNVNSMMRQNHLLVTDSAGIAKLSVVKGDSLSSFTAWTTDHRIGGYQFSRQPTRDPQAASHVIEISKCRPQKIRFLNAADKSPVPDIGFSLYVATPAPFHNFMGLIPESAMTTDAKGEATYAWFPDWPTHFYYIDYIDKHWTKLGKESLAADGTIEVLVKKSQLANRKTVTGQVLFPGGNPAGFSVEMDSFEAEEENRIDQLRAFTDAQGRFTVNVLPGSTYCAHLGDGPLLSDMITVLAYDPKTEQVTEPKLTITEGAPVEISVNQGPNKTPIAGINVSLRTNHHYTRIVKGESAGANGCRDWWLKADDEGKVKTWALPGKTLDVSVHEPGWALQASSPVKAGEVTKIELHRPMVARKKVTGQFILPADLKVTFDKVKASMSAIDGIVRDEDQVSVDAEGKFAFDTSASQFGIFAYSTDNKAAVAAVVEMKDVEGPLTLTLQPTGEYEGKILDVGGAPRANYPVRASFDLKIANTIGAPDFKASFAPTSFTPRTIETKTDSEGNFTLTGIPFSMPTHITAGADRGPESHYVSKILLTSGEKRPRDVSRLSATSAAAIPLKDRYATSLRDAKLNGYHLLIVCFEPTAENEAFVNQHFYNYQVNRDVAGYMHVYFRRKDATSSPLGNEFAKTMGWPEYEPGKIVAIAMNSEGKELGRLEIDPKDTAAPDKSIHFVHEHASPPPDAKKKWEEAFALAAKTDRKVWVRISQRFCGPCHILNRWLDDQQELIDKDYVLLKVDDVRDLYGEEVSRRLTQGNQHGVPFHGIFNSEGTLLIDSTGPLGNIGAPSGFEGGKHLLQMFQTTRTKLTDEEIEKLIKSLPE